MIVSYRSVSLPYDVFINVSVVILCFFLSFKGFECNLKIHTNVNHFNGLSSRLFYDMANNQIKNEPETIAQQIEVWIEEQKDEIGMLMTFVVRICPKY